MHLIQVLTTALLWLTVGSQRTQTVLTHDKIVGGYPVPICDVPYQVSIRRRSLHEIEFGLGHFCGGTVISQRVICSAAHCVAINNTHPAEYMAAEKFVVVAGGKYVTQLEGLTQIYSVQQIIGHERYNCWTLENDIALLFLNRHIPWHYHTIRSLPLAEQPQPPGTYCFVSGWGKIHDGLHQAKVPILDQRMCSYIYKNIPVSQLCAGYLSGGVDACIGDSGGPLVCNGTLAGIISWGVECGKLFYPGVYTNVSHYLNWITKANSSLDYSRFVQMRNLNGVRSTSQRNFGSLYVIYVAWLMAIMTVE